MLAVGRGRDRLLRVLTAGCADADGIDGGVGEQVVKRLGRHAEALGDLVESGGVTVADCDQASALVGAGADGLQVVVGHHAGAEDGEAQVGLARRLRRASVIWRHFVSSHIRRTNAAAGAACDARSSQRHSMEMRPL